MIDRHTYKERDYANEILEKGFLTRYINYEMSLLCKLWYEMGQTKREMEDNLTLFCKIYMPNFNQWIHYSMIDAAINKVFRKKSKLIQIESVPIYKHEVDFINSIDFPHPYKRLLFALLVLKKIHSEIWRINSGEHKLSSLFDGSEKQRKMVSEMAHLKGGKKENIGFMIYDLSQEDLVTSLALARVQLDFIDDIKEQESEEVIRVSHFDHVWMYFDYLVGYNRAGKVKLCGECGVPFHVKGNRQKYCELCATTVRREKENARVREAMRKRRSTSD